ncbi:hypothetical protein CYLTODRAFT_426774 [Cylindrobasidium torrendii FP15055 ss-10]|uniref:F-box domain-containing protein n=1 Tax=Cylindrobasidium torrendii FP15055 ss-10 TaxID=1314674 RepID=A0A0D7AZA0_9AGAR|nr:hypothetical protein CYLTODRAFT_426774 [Cylindrobasidium torrendii FP15055 ss-10]
MYGVSQVPRLPQELINEVIDHLGAEPSESFAALYQSARCFGPGCQKYIYRSVVLAVEEDDDAMDVDDDEPAACFTLDAETAQLFDFVRTKAVAPNVVRHVRIYLPLDGARDVPWNALADGIRRLTQVETVELDFGSGDELNDALIAGLHACLPQTIRRISIENLCISPPSLCHLLAPFSALEEVELCFADRMPDDQALPDLASIQVLPFQSLTLVTANREVEWDLAESPYFHKAFQNLRHIKLDAMEDRDLTKVISAYPNLVELDCELATENWTTLPVELCKPSSMVIRHCSDTDMLTSALHHTSTGVSWRDLVIVTNVMRSATQRANAGIKDADLARLDRECSAQLVAESLRDLAVAALNAGVRRLCVADTGDATEGELQCINQSLACVGVDKGKKLEEIKFLNNSKLTAALPMRAAAYFTLF